MIEIAWRLDPRTGRFIVMSAEDNLVKGASGQAVQSMNILLRVSGDGRVGLSLGGLSIQCSVFSGTLYNTRS